VLGVKVRLGGEEGIGYNKKWLDEIRLKVSTNLGKSSSKKTPPK